MTHEYEILILLKVLRRQLDLNHVAFEIRGSHRECNPDFHPIVYDFLQFSGIGCDGDYISSAEVYNYVKKHPKYLRNKWIKEECRRIARWEEV